MTISIILLVIQLYSIQLQINGDVIEVTRATSADRATTYATYNNTFRPEVLNKDIDRIWLRIQELGVADVLLKIYTDKLHTEQKNYIDNQDQIIKKIIEDLRGYVNQQDNKTNDYFTDLINKQGISLQHLENYYQYLLESMADIASEKGWIASLITDESGKSQQEINNKIKSENVSVWDFFTKQELINYKSNPTTFDCARPLQAFFDFICLNELGTAYCNGYFYTSKAILFGRGTNGLTKNIVGSFKLQALNAIDILFTVDCGQDIVWNGSIHVIGTGSVAYSSRTCRIGISMGTYTTIASRCKFLKLYAQRFYEYGVHAPQMASLSDWGFIRCYDCGSGYITSNYSLKTNYTFVESTGSFYSTGQRSVISVSTLPPELLEIGRDPVLLLNGTSAYYVYDIDRVNNKLSVFPFLSEADKAGGEFRYSFGGGVGISGGDSSVVGIDCIDAVRCSRAYVNTALYSANVGRIITQYVGIAVVLGQNPSAAHLGGNIGHLYCENNEYNIARITRAAMNVTIGAGTAFDLSKSIFLGAFRTSLDTLGSFNNLAGFSIFDGTNGHLEYRDVPITSNLDISKGGVHDIVYYSNTLSITLVEPQKALTDLFNRTHRRFVVYGSGINGTPTATTFQVDSASTMTINSSAIKSVTFNAVAQNGASIFDVYAYKLTDGSTRFFITHSNSGKTVQLSATTTYDPPSLAAGATQTTTVTLTGAILGDTVACSFNRSLSGSRMWAEVTATDTVTVYHKNETASALDIASGTLKVKII